MVTWMEDMHRGKFLLLSPSTSLGSTRPAVLVLE